MDNSMYFSAFTTIGSSTLAYCSNACDSRFIQQLLLMPIQYIEKVRRELQPSPGRGRHVGEVGGGPGAGAVTQVDGALVPGGVDRADLPLLHVEAQRVLP